MNQVDGRRGARMRLSKAQRELLEHLVANHGESIGLYGPDWRTLAALERRGLARKALLWRGMQRGYERGAEVTEQGRALSSPQGETER